MDTILYPIMWVISYVMYGVHEVLVKLGMSSGSGPAWVLSIVGLTIIIRILIIPLFNRQTRASRASQELSPKIQKIQNKYKGRTDSISQQRQQEEMMALYRDHGTSPFSACMPALIQMPIFFSLYRILYAVLPISQGAYRRESLGAMNKDVASEIANSTVFGAPISSSIGTASTFAQSTNVIVVAVTLIALMIITLVFSQRQIMTKNMPESATDPDNPAAKMQKYMIYGMPMIYIFSGSFFQVGVLVYWLTGNLWNIGQQTWLISHNPAPGSAAYKAREKKIREKRIKQGLPPEEAKDEGNQGELSGQRAQPLGKKRSKKARQTGVVPENSIVPEDSATETEPDDGEVRGPDGLTDAERAQKRYERRLAERQRAKEKKNKQNKRRQQNQKKRNY